MKLYVSLSQTFSIWLIPFHVAKVALTTVLDLTTESPSAGSPDGGDRGLYYIAKQEDLYQTSEFINFVIPYFGHYFVLVFYLFATLFCIVGAVVLSPITWLEEKGYLRGPAVW